MCRNIYLTELEEKALGLFAKGVNTRIICRELAINHEQLATLTFAIRRKTGIADHNDDRQCQDYLRRYRHAIERNATTPEHIIALRVYTKTAWESDSHAAHTVVHITQEAIELCGIFSKDERTRKMQVRQYLATFHCRNKMPPTDTEIQILRLVASGVKAKELCLHLQGAPRYFVHRLRDVCKRLGFNVQGRGAQRRMIQDYLARTEPPTMDDPMF